MTAGARGGRLAPACSEVVEELERNGQNLQHFCRELARYFRNLLVAKIAGRGNAPDRGFAAEQARMREIAAEFTEEDLTRYLQLTLDMFKDLQFSLQPRLHLEIGLLGWSTRAGCCPSRRRWRVSKASRNAVCSHPKQAGDRQGTALRTLSIPARSPSARLRRQLLRQLRPLLRRRTAGVRRPPRGTARRPWSNSA